MKKICVALFGALVLATMLSSCVALSLGIGAAQNKAAENSREKEANKYLEGYGDRPTVLVYGLLKTNYTTEALTFIQTDSRNPPSALLRFNGISGGYVYYGEALCGVSYKLYKGKFVSQGYNRLVR